MILLFTLVSVSALKGHYGKAATFRQHYYPEGGWGWVITVCAAIVQIFTTGIQLSFGVLYLQLLKFFGEDNIMGAGNLWPINADTAEIDRAVTVVGMWSLVNCAIHILFKIY